MSGSWKNPAIRAAEGRFDEAIQAAERRVAETREFLAEQTSSPDSADEVRRLFQEYARRPDAPRPIRDLYRRVAEGDITWDDVFAGRAGTDEIRAVFEANLPVLDDLRKQLNTGEPSGGNPNTDADPSSTDAVEQRWTGPYYVHPCHRRVAGPDHGLA